MSGRESAALLEALRMVEGGSSAYAAAKASGIALSTIYRALRRRRLRGASTVYKKPPASA